MYADLERDVFYMAKTRAVTQLDPRGGCLEFYPAVCWMPEALSQVRHIAVPVGGDRMHGAFVHFEDFPNLRTVRVVLRRRQQEHTRPGADTFLRRLRDLPRDAFGFVELHRFCDAFGGADTAWRTTHHFFGMKIDKIRRAEWCNRYTVKDGVEKIPVVDGCFDGEL